MCIRDSANTIKQQNQIIANEQARQAAEEAAARRAAQQQQQQNKDEMSKENAQQLLNAVMQDEKNVQDKVKKQLQIQGKKLDKDW